MTISSWHCFRKTYFCFQGVDSEVSLAKIIQEEVTFAKRRLNLLFTINFSDVVCNVFFMKQYKKSH